MCGRIGAKPEDMIAVLMYESGLDPSATPPPPNSAKGLNQIIRPVGKELGMSDAFYDNYDKLFAINNIRMPIMYRIRNYTSKTWKRR